VPRKTGLRGPEVLQDHEVELSLRIVGDLLRPGKLSALVGELREAAHVVHAGLLGEYPLAIIGSVKIIIPL
jgi:hypothetical protein